MAKGAPPRSLDGLAALIAKQNPYTSGQIDDMDLYIWPPNPDDPDGHQGSRAAGDLCSLLLHVRAARIKTRRTRSITG